MSKMAAQKRPEMNKQAVFCAFAFLAKETSSSDYAGKRVGLQYEVGRAPSTSMKRAAALRYG